jgi:hypothetical protein
LYFPFNEVKESFRFFNFEWIDLRNYYNLLIWHNTLVDLSINNNIIYNDLLNNLYNNLSLYGFKVSKFYNIKFKSIYWTKSLFHNIEQPKWKSQISKDTDLLNNLLKDQNKAFSLKKLHKYRWFRKHLTVKLKVKFKVTKWNRAYRYLKEVHHITHRTKKNFDNRLAAMSEKLSYNINFNNLLKNSVPLKPGKKHDLFLYTLYYKGSIKKKISRKYVPIQISKYSRLRNVPLKYYIIQYKINPIFRDFTKVAALLSKSIEISHEGNKWVSVPHAAIVNVISRFYYYIIHFHDEKNHLYFFKRIYKFNYYKNKMLVKNKIPIYAWVESIWKRRIAQKHLNLFRTCKTNEKYILNTYHDLMRKALKLKNRFFFKFIYRRYPYRLNKYDNILNSNLNYFNLLPNNGIKLIKKYYYLRNLKKRHFYKLHKNFYELNKLHSNTVLRKFQNWNKPFIYKYCQSFDLPRNEANIEWIYLKYLNFWSFFDYLKVNKYYTYKYKDIYKNENKNFINFKFLKRFRKDYINSRNYIMRFISAYLYYEYLKKIQLLVPIKPKFIRYKDPKPLNYRLKWGFNIYLNFRKEKKKNIKFVLILCHIFEDRFKVYHKYVHFKINSHNAIYKKSIKSYKISVLNRISNLKRFFFYRNKRFNGWAIWNYIRSFSFKFHIKHLLWHSPYSYIFFNNQNKNENFIEHINYNKYVLKYNLLMDFNKINILNDFYIRLYSVLAGYRPKIYLLSIIKGLKWNIYTDSDLIKSIIINKDQKFNIMKSIPITINKYSLIFNLYSNVINIKQDWSYVMFNNQIDLNKFLLDTSFNDYYYYGHFNSYKNISLLEGYRLFITLLFQYYNNFLFRLSRYIYIISLKDYTLIKFFKKYFNFKDWLLHFYMRFRIQLYPSYIFGRGPEDEFYSQLVSRESKYAYKVRRIELAPFWFIFYKYIKLFIYFLLNKYYTKNFIIKWWLNYQLNFSLYFKFIIFYYSLILKFKNLMVYNNIIYIYYINLLIIKIYYKYIYYINLLFKFILQLLVYYNFNIYVWYVNILFKFNINDYLLKFLWLFNYNNFKQLLNIFWLKINFNLNNIINMRNFFLYKLYIKGLIQHYVDILFKIKNKLIYYKSNYFYWRKPKNLNRMRNYKTRMSKSFINVRTRRNYNSFYNLTFNSFFLKNLYNFNLNMYIYLWNSYDLKLDIKILFTPFIYIKYNIDDYLILFYWIVYLLFLLFIYIFYKKFFNLFFFSKKLKKMNLNSQYNLDLFMKSDVMKILKLKYNNKNLFYKYIFKNHLKKNFTENFFNIFINKYYKSFGNYLIYTAFKTSFFNSSFYIKFKDLFGINNNLLSDSSKSYLFVNLPYIFNNDLLKSNKLLNLFSLNFFSYKKENKKYNLFSNNYIYSNNIFYFLIFYWLFLVPLFFFEYIIYRYHLRGHVLKKRKLIILCKIFLDNFKLYIKLFKLLGEQTLYHKQKSKYIRNYLNTQLYRKKKKMRGLFFKWERYNDLYLRMSPMGSYYYWFAHINKWHYFICYYKYFFNSIFKCYYIKYFNFIFLILLFFIFKKYKNNNFNLYKIKNNNFNLFKMKSLLNILKLK